MTLVRGRDQDSRDRSDAGGAAERDGVDAAGVDALRLGHVPILDHGAQVQSEPGLSEDEDDRGDDYRRE